MIATLISVRQRSPAFVLHQRLERRRIHLFSFTGRNRRGSSRCAPNDAAAVSVRDGIQQQARVETVHEGRLVAHPRHEELAGVDARGNGIVFLDTAAPC